MNVDQSTEAVWERLRATRWNPPAPTTTAVERRTTYVFALEQAEQMFRAATAIGTATRPLLIYYGLSQAGRAIAAAASSISSGDKWRLNGHGIKSVALDGPLPDVEVRTERPDDRGSFVRLSELLNSPLWGKAQVRFNLLWDMLPENEQSPLLDTGRLRRTPLLVDHRDLYREPHPLASISVGRFPPWVTNAEDGRKILDSYLKAFPDAQGYYDFRRVGREPDANPDFLRRYDGWGYLEMHWRLPEGSSGSHAQRLALLEAMTRTYKGVLYFLPAITPNQGNLHPLMAWWAVLHALSMLARYQPAEWATHINVDRSQHAVAIERLLKESIRVLPLLVEEAIEQVSGDLAEREPA